jgi:hypothetical protein
MAVFSATKKANPAPQSLRDVAPKWAAISDKLTQLCEREEQIFAEMKPLQAALNESRQLLSFDTSGPSRKKEPVQIKASQAAADILGDLTPTPKTIPAFVAPVPAEVTKLREFSVELDAVREAIELLRSPQKGERHSPWAQAHVEGSKKYCELIEPEYSQVASGYLDALVALGRATVAYNDFVKQHLVGVAFEHLRPIQTSPSLGDPLDRQSEIRRLLAWAAECGRFNLKNIPDEWKDSKK